MKIDSSWTICRICLQEGNLVAMSAKDERNVSFKKKIEMCCGIKLNTEKRKEFPKDICTKCLQYLNISYKFRIMCRKADERLLNFTRLRRGDALNNRTASEKDIKITLNLPPLVFGVDVLLPQINDNAESIEPKNKTNNIGKLSSYEEDSEEDKLCVKESSNHSLDLVNVKKELHMNVEDDGIQKKTRKLHLKSKSSKKNLTKIKNTAKDSTESSLLPLICEICGNSFSKRYLLWRHMKNIHEKVKNYECEICGKKFGINSSQLTRHMRVHTGEKPYPCEHCGRSFKDSGTRSKHIRMHTGERPFVCETCGKRFATNYVLQNHMVTHTGDRPFECTLCDKKFAFKHQFDDHRKTQIHKRMKDLKSTDNSNCTLLS